MDNFSPINQKDPLTTFFVSFQLISKEVNKIRNLLWFSATGRFYAKKSVSRNWKRNPIFLTSLENSNAEKGQQTTTLRYRYMRLRQNLELVVVSNDSSKDTVVKDVTRPCPSICLTLSFQQSLSYIGAKSVERITHDSWLLKNRRRKRTVVLVIIGLLKKSLLFSSTSFFGFLCHFSFVQQ